MKEFTEAILMMFNAGIITQEKAKELYFKAVEEWLKDDWHHHHEEQEDGEEMN